MCTHAHAPLQLLEKASRWLASSFQMQICFPWGMDGSSGEGWSPAAWLRWGCLREHPGDLGTRLGADQGLEPGSLVLQAGEGFLAPVVGTQGLFCSCHPLELKQTKLRPGSCRESTQASWTRVP